MPVTAAWSLSNAEPGDGLAQRLLAGIENDGLKLAIIGRTVAILLLAAWFVATRSGTSALGWALLLAAFAATGLVHYRLIGTRFDRWWLKYAIISLDVIDIGLLIALVRPYPADDMPQILVYQLNPIQALYALLALCALSLSPLLVLWCGMLSAVTWLAAFAWIAAGMDNPMGWSDLPKSAPPAELTSLILSPDFAAPGSRVQEALLMLVVTGLLALAVHRARSLVRRMLAAEAERSFIANTLGQYVPETVARAIIADRGRLQPARREATVLFADLDGFTHMAEHMAPDAVITMLNGFFSAMTQLVAEHQGVVIGFTGDGFIATFNAPLETPDHARLAVSSAQAIQAFMLRTSFAGQQLSLRLGIATGPLAAGSVGGGGRRTYTVYGDTVNLASRLEQLNKRLGTRLLLAESTAAALGPDQGLDEVGLVELQGLSRPIRVFAPAQPVLAAG